MSERTCGHLRGTRRWTHVRERTPSEGRRGGRRPPLQQPREAPLPLGGKEPGLPGPSLPTGVRGSDPPQLRRSRQKPGGFQPRAGLPAQGSFRRKPGGLRGAKPPACVTVSLVSSRVLILRTLLSTRSTVTHVTRQNTANQH